MDFLKLPKTKQNRINLSQFNYHHFYDKCLDEPKFAEKFIILEDNSIALLKMPLSSLHSYSGVLPYGKLDIQPDEYNPLISKKICNIANIECASYFLASERPNNYILTPSFLNKDDELITGNNLVRKNEYDINNILKDLEQSLTLRRFNQDEINKIKDDFIKQCFISKFIGNIDEHSYNFGIILNDRHIKLAPFFDLEYSFGICDESLGRDRHIDGDSSLNKFIENFKDYPGFLEFVNNLITKINIEKLFISVEANTGIKADTFLRNFFTNFINKQINICKRTLDIIKEKGDYEL